MEYLYPLLLYAGLGGGLVLLGVESISPLRMMRKPLTAAWITMMTFLWMILPMQGRWILSVWSPGAVLGGQILLNMNPAVWWCGLALGAVFSGAAWVEVTERREPLPLTGPLVLAAMLAIWGALTGGSLLTTLATWAVFDLVWCAAGLMSGADGERVIFGLALHGISSIILWAVSLFMLQSGESGLWWLMWPTTPILTLLLIAALMRLGFYPFQIVFPRTLGPTRLLSIIYLMGPVSGLALFFRLLVLPGEAALPEWAILWGVFSFFWCGLMAWSTRGRQSMSWGGHALLICIVAGAGIVGSGQLLMMGTAVWIAGGALLVLARGRDVRAIGWSWPAWIAVFFFLGIPPSPIGALYRILLDAMPWVWRAPLLIGGILVGAVFLRGVSQRAPGAATPPWMWQRVGMGLGLAVIVASLFATAVAGGAMPAEGALERMLWPPPSWLGLGLWLLVVMVAGIVARWGGPVRHLLQGGKPVLEFLDLQWFYRAMWRGTEHALTILRASAEVVEGSGAVLWSLLILLLVLLVVTSR